MKEPKTPEASHPSHEPSQDSGDVAHFRQEPDPSHNKSALRVGLVTAIIFIGGVIWAWTILVSREKLIIPDGPIPDPPEAVAHQEEIGIVFQTQFGDKAWPAENRKKEERLRNYGWADRKNNRIFIPIERAMEMVAAGKRK